MSDHEETFDAGDAGASMTRPINAGSVKKNGFVMLKGHACKVVEYSTSKTGKHGHAKAHIVGLDLFTGKKYEDICPTSHNMDEPIVKRTEYQVLSVSNDGFVSLLQDNGTTKDDIQISNDDDNGCGAQLKKWCDEGKDCVATVICAIGKEKIIAVKET